MQTTPTPKMTVADLDHLLWERGRYYELFDGQLVPHDDTTEGWWSFSLLAFFYGILGTDGPRPDHCPKWKVDEHNLYRPHIVFSPYDISHDLHDGRDPILAADVLPQSRPTPDPRRLSAYARAGLRWYWTVDSQIPAITIFKLTSGELIEHARVEGDEIFDVAEPFSVKLCPARQLGV